MLTIQSFPAVGTDVGQTQRIIIPWNKDKFPSTASPATVTASAVNALAVPGGAGQASIADTYAGFDWTSTANLSAVTAGAEVAVGQQMRKPTGATSALVIARVYVNNKDRFSQLNLALNDENSHSATADILSSLTNGTFGDFTLTVDLTSPATWGNYIGVTIVAQGTTDKTKVGATQFFLDYLAVEFS